MDNSHVHMLHLIQPIPSTPKLKFALTSYMIDDLSDLECDLFEQTEHTLKF